MKKNEIFATAIAMAITVLLLGCVISGIVSAALLWALNHLEIWELELSIENVVALGIVLFTITYLLRGGISAKG